MDSSTDEEDSVLDSEDINMGTFDSFDNYSQHISSNKESDFDEIPRKMPAFDSDNCFSYPSHKRKISSDDDQQYSNTLKYDEINSNHDEGTLKRRRRDNSDTIDITKETKCIPKIEIDPVDKLQIDRNVVSHLEKAQKMMKRMGYQPGQGLGKHGQGRVEPVEAVTQHGRRGFGHVIPGLKEASLKWIPEDEEIKIKEDIEWLQNMYLNTLKDEDMIDWIKWGPRKEIIDDEVTFCEPEIVEQIIRSKTVFDKLDKAEMRKARIRSNPFETIRSANFLNRAAVKMANINKACNFMFTDQRGPYVDPNETLYFADVCAGPGGFSEYILSRKKWHSKGFGFTLKNENDFKLDDFFAGPCETFHPFYGSKDNGDVFDPKNQEEFKSLVMKHTNNIGVHFMMSDGGFSVEGQENIQEILSKQLYLCQCLVALMIVRPGGHFVTKLFDLFTPFSAGLVYLMYRCFDSISIFKPNTSRPANSERYLICKRKKIDTQVVMEYLSHVNHLLLERDSNRDVLELVPLDILEADTGFITFLRDSNASLGKKQIIGLLKIAAFCEDPSLIEPKQAEMRKECLKYWDITDKSRMRPQAVKPQDKIKEIMKSIESMECLRSEPKKLTIDNVKDTVLNQPFDWYCMPCSSGPYVEEDKMATFYLGMGRRKVFRYVRGQWNSIGDLKLELPPDTLVYAELVYETKWTGKYFSKTRALHILDAYMLGGEDVSKLYLSHRYKLTKKFCDALWKPTPNDFVCVRARERFLLAPDIEKRLRVSQRRVKSISMAFEFAKNSLERDHDKDTEPLYIPFNSVIFLRSIVHPWSRFLSQRTNFYYVFNSKTGQKEYEVRNGQNNRPSEAVADFTAAFNERVIWYWPQNNNILNMDALGDMIKHPHQKV